MRIETIGEATLYLGDCLEYMASLPDKTFELAIVDPPYGGGADGSISRTGGTWTEKYYKKGERKTKTTEWDSAPNKEYFDELFRVSKNQIIWGGNYFSLPPFRNFIIWRKLTISENFTMAMAEYAWTNIEGNAKVFDCAPQGTAAESRIHPTQKPVALYKWILSRYAKPGDRIIDTHGGSGSSVIACIDAGYPIVWIEKDEDYYEAALKRIKNFAAQPRLFEDEKPEPGQCDLGLTPSP